MKTSCLLALLSLASLTGCNDSSTPARSSQAESGNSPRTVSAIRHTQKPIDVEAINKAVESFYIQEGRFPTNLIELALRDYIPIIPVLPVGMAWDYDTNTGVVSIIKEAIRD